MTKALKKRTGRLTFGSGDRQLFLDPRLGLMHQVMLGDRLRLETYDAALARDIRPGDTVVDVGAGCLALTFLALNHHAGHVFAIEGDPATAMLARAVVADNDLGDRVTVIEGDARTVSIPRRADVLVSEMLGNIGPEEEMAEILAVCVKRHLKPGGAVVPRRIVTEIRAVQFDGEGWGVWSSGIAGYSLASVAHFLGSAAQLHFFARQPHVLGETVALIDVELGTSPAPLPEVCRIPIAAPGRLEAMVLSFKADFGQGIELSNFPGYPGCNWAVYVWPLAATMVGPGDELNVAIHPGEQLRDALAWRLDCGIARASGRRAAP